MIKKTLGGDRLGSGNKMQAALHNYERSTHDLGNVWRSTMAPGVLVPFYKKLCTNGDTWSINLQSLVRTMPAIGPLFGSYKLQMDVFEVPIRLYNGILHNNMTKIGMDMAQVKMPKIQLQHRYKNPENTSAGNSKTSQISPDSLMCYLGLRGIGAAELDAETEYLDLTRKFNAVPVLGYYDIFKNYYANKQEQKAYVITGNVKETIDTLLTKLTNTSDGYALDHTDWANMPLQGANNMSIGGQSYRASNLMVKNPQQAGDDYDINGRRSSSRLNNLSRIKLEFNGNYQRGTYCPILVILDTQTNKTRQWPLNGNTFNTITNQKNNTLEVNLDVDGFCTDWGAQPWQCYITTVYWRPDATTTSSIKLQPFDLENIDNMRVYLLSNTQLGTENTINDQGLYPYKANYEVLDDHNSGCELPMAGLVVKTYQSDIFNNWLSSQWIDGIKGVNAISAVAIEDGKFTIDALNLAHKVYNMLNRIAVSGGTYEDWQEAVYGEDAIRRAESPIYCGGMSGTIAFEEVVSTADTDTTQAGDQPLGSLAGKGILTNVNGGNIEIHIKEPSYIMGIVSITPYIDYCDGNDFDMTEIDSLNDIHKPELDEIGFQDLILERAAWWTTLYDDGAWMQEAGGKLPAWIEYMTSVNQVYGEFAEKSKLGYMVLTRSYDMGWNYDNNSRLDTYDQPRTIAIKDWTTYINPTKYNYQFANSKLDAQNFWVQIGIHATARRKMSAKLIPNL